METECHWPFMLTGMKNDNDLLNVLNYLITALLGTGHPNAGATCCQELHPVGVM